MANSSQIQTAKRALVLLISSVSAMFMAALFLFGLDGWTPPTFADPIDPPEGYPKLILSMKSVSPTLVNVGGETLTYLIEIRNTGAYTAEGALLTNPIPVSTSYNSDAWSSVDPQPTYSNGEVRWEGDVGFDSSVEIIFSVDVDPGFE